MFQGRRYDVIEHATLLAENQKQRRGALGHRDRYPSPIRPPSDGIEVTIVGAIGPVLQSSETLGLSAKQIGAAGSAYVIGAVAGALFFG